MPSFDSLSTVDATGEVVHTHRYAVDLAQLVDRERSAGRTLLDFREVRRQRSKPSRYLDEKRLIYHRISQAMRHRSYSLRDTAIALREAFPSNSRRHRVARSFLKSCETLPIAFAMEEHPQMFSEHEIEAMIGTTNASQTMQVLAKTTTDRRRIARDVGSALAMPMVNASLLAVAIVMVFTNVIPKLKTDIFPSVQEIPPFFLTLVAVSDWLHVPGNALLLGIGFASVVLFALTMYRISTPLQAYTVALVFHRARAYGRALHLIDRREVYAVMINVLQANRIDHLIESAARVAGAAGAAALRRAAHTPLDGSNPLSRLRGAVPYLPRQEVALLIAAYGEGGVTGTISELESIIADCDEDIPREIEAMKRQIAVTSNTILGAVIGVVFIGLASQITGLILHIH